MRQAIDATESTGIANAVASEVLCYSSTDKCQCFVLVSRCVQ
jgi:hypothetical protein